MSDQETAAAGRGLTAQVYVDGASLGNPGPAGVGVLIQTLQVGGERAELTVEEPIGEATNNQAEYRALIRALEECQRLGIPSVRVHLDSELVVRQMGGRYRVKDEKLLPLYIRARELVKSLPKVEIRLIPREENKVANNLAQNVARMARASLAVAGGQGGKVFPHKRVAFPSPSSPDGAPTSPAGTDPPGKEQ